MNIRIVKNTKDLMNQLNDDPEAYVAYGGAVFRLVTDKDKKQLLVYEIYGRGILSDPLKDAVNATAERFHANHIDIAKLNRNINPVTQEFVVDRATPTIEHAREKIEEFLKKPTALAKAAVVQEIQSLPAQVAFADQNTSFVARFFKSKPKKSSETPSQTPQVERKKSGPGG